MVDTQRFEGLLESLGNEIDDLEVGFSTKDNLTNIFQGLYSIFEEVNCAESELERLTEENEILKQILADRISYEDKQYFRIKYGIDLGV